MVVKSRRFDIIKTMFCSKLHTQLSPAKYSALPLGKQRLAVPASSLAPVLLARPGVAEVALAARLLTRKKKRKVEINVGAVRGERAAGPWRDQCIQASREIFNSVFIL